MQTRSFLSFTAGILVGTGVWLPIFVAASAEGDAHGWSTLVSLVLFAVAGLLNGRFERWRPRSAIRSAEAPAAVEVSEAPTRVTPTRETASHAAQVGAFASTSQRRCSAH